MTYEKLATLAERKYLFITALTGPVTVRESYKSCLHDHDHHHPHHHDE